MASTLERAARVINGTHGRLERDGVRWAETTGFQLKIAKTKESIKLCGDMMERSKTTSLKGTGSVTLYHVDSDVISDDLSILNGVENPHTLVGTLADPDAVGAERVAVTGVSFDDITLADWKAATVGTVTKAFTFTGVKLLDTIGVQ